MKTFRQLIMDCRANSDAKQPELITSDLLTQILSVLVEIRDELKKTPKTSNGAGFWPVGGVATAEGDGDETVVQAPVPFI